MKKEYYVLKIYSKFYIYASLIIGILEVITHTSMGDETWGLLLTLDRIELFAILVLHVGTLALAYPFFLKTKDKRIRFHKGNPLKFEINTKKIHIFMVLLIISNIYATVQLGNATVGKTATSSWAAIFNIIQVRPIFMIYYVCARDIKKNIYWINILLYIIYQFLCGWSGHIMIIVFLEMYLRIKHNKYGSLVNNLLKVNDVLVGAAFTFGSWLYCFVFPFKNSIRYGLKIGALPSLNYIEGVKRLISRFTNYPIAVAAIQNHSKMVDLYRSQERPLWEIEAIFSPLLPRFIMPNKEFRPLANIVSWAFSPNFGMNSGTGYNMFIYWFNLFESDFICFFLGINIFILFFVISKKLIYAFDNGSKDVEVLYFLLVYGIFAGGQLASTFGYGYIALVYTIPIMWFLGIIKIKKINPKKETLKYYLRSESLV